MQQEFALVAFARFGRHVMIEIQQVQKQFGSLTVLPNISLTVQDGEIYGLVGKSGAGKSTLLRCINGLESYSSGSIRVNGVEVKDLNKRELQRFRKDIAMIFQQFPLLSRKTVFENIAFPMSCWHYDKRAIRARVEELAELVGISDKLKEKPRSLSGGQQQRVAIARALSMDPKILLCDEATSALDPTTTQSILQLLREINERLGLTIVVVTHQMEVIRQVCQTVSLLEGGQITLSGKVDEIFLRQPEAWKRFLGMQAIQPSGSGACLQIMLADESPSQSVLSTLARDLGVEYRILSGKIEQYRDSHLGYLTIQVDASDEARVKQYLDEHQVVWHPCE